MEVLSPSHQHSTSFAIPGPLSIPEFEGKHPALFAQVFSHSRNYPPYRDNSEDLSKASKIQCHGAPGNPHSQDKSMSQGPPKTHPASKSPHEERQKRLPPLGPRSLPPLQNATNFGSCYDAASNVPATQNVSARQPPQASTTPDQRSSRPIGVQNLLNPTSNGEATNGQSRRRNGERVESPTGDAPFTTMQRAATPSLPTPSIINRSPVNVSLPSITPPTINVYPQSLGRSPSSYTPSPITMNIPSGTMDAKQSPFVLPRDHTVVGGPGAPSLPELSRAPSIIGEPHMSSAPPSRSPPGRRGSQDSNRYERMQSLLNRTGGAGTGPHRPASQSDSPSTQYSSYSQVSRQTPPAPSSVPTGQPQSFFTTPFNASGPASTMAQLAFDVPASSGASGGSTYQMMTLDTENGPIQVPVDVQAASKVADEKRKRNATASHRFRQRRKERERETSQNISKLEQQIREIEEEKEFYRGERDYFRNLASRVPGQAHLMSRPISPRQRRHASLGGAMGFSNSLQLQGSDNGNRNSGRNTKRRTNSYAPPSGPPPQAEMPPSMPQYTSAPSNVPEHNLGNNRIRPHETLSLQTGPFDTSTRR